MIDRADKREGCEMHEFKIKVARIEAVTANTTGDQVCVTFEVERGSLRLKIPIMLHLKEFDDTEMIQVARNELHQMFLELAEQTIQWTLTAEDIEKLSSMSSRPGS
jgi:glutathionylspermidine synthase